MGNKDHFLKEYNTAIAEKDRPSRLLLDLDGKPVRNRYLPEYQRRLDINKVSQAELRERLPIIGPVRAQKIADYIKKNGAILVRWNLHHGPWGKRG